MRNEKRRKKREGKTRNEDRRKVKEKGRRKDK